MKNENQGTKNVHEFLMIYLFGAFLSSGCLIGSYILTNNFNEQFSSISTSNSELDKKYQTISELRHISRLLLLTAFDIAASDQPRLLVEDLEITYSMYQEVSKKEGVFDTDVLSDGIALVHRSVIDLKDTIHDLVEVPVEKLKNRSNILVVIGKKSSLVSSRLRYLEVTVQEMKRNMIFQTQEKSKIFGAAAKIGVYVLFAFLALLTVLGFRVSSRLKQTLLVYRERDDAKLMVAESGKLASLGEMAGGIAHEINNPIASIIGHAEILIKRRKKGKLSDEIFSDLTQKIIKSGERIAKTVKGLRAFSRNAENDSYISTSLDEILLDSFALCVERLRHNEIKLTLPSDSSGIYVDCRESEISQVLVNLLNNANDAIEHLENKWITVDIRKKKPDYVDIVVTDCGTGIPEEIREKILQPFFSTKDVGKGTGLGLSISKKIVEQHGGVFTIDSNSPNTCFVVSLPIGNSQP